MFLLFCDTLMEDPDLYRYLHEAAHNVFGGKPNLVRLCDGRTPWQVFRDEKMMGNSRADPCSRILKREIADNWLLTNMLPESTVVYLGIDWTKRHRYDDGAGHGARYRFQKLGYACEAPMCEPPYVWKHDIMNESISNGIEIPYLYGLGFSHNNCGGFCVKAGHGHFTKFLNTLPDRYAVHERHERAPRRQWGKNVSILRDRSRKRSAPLTLQKLRERAESSQSVDLFDIGGCGCFIG